MFTKEQNEEFRTQAKARIDNYNFSSSESDLSDDDEIFEDKKADKERKDA
jgi:hypothetical protein